MALAATALDRLQARERQKVADQPVHAFGDFHAVAGGFAVFI
jgi:hypothetical protein